MTQRTFAFAAGNGGYALQSVYSSVKRPVQHR